MGLNAPVAKRSLGFLWLMVGLVIGGFVGATLFRSLEPRSLLAWNACQDRSCLRLNEISGLVAAVGVKVAPGKLPLVIRETQYSLVIQHPLPEMRVHYIVIPKKDIKNIGELSAEDQVYLIDAYAVIQDLIKSENLKTYMVKTNGPGYQDVAYLHFHLMAE